MVKYCVAAVCRNTTMNGTKMHYFPKNPTRRKLWAKMINRDNFVPSDYSTICSDHFSKDSYQLNWNGKLLLRKDAVPTLFHKNGKGFRHNNLYESEGTTAKTAYLELSKVEEPTFYTCSILQDDVVDNKFEVKQYTPDKNTIETLTKVDNNELELDTQNNIKFTEDASLLDIIAGSKHFEYVKLLKELNKTNKILLTKIKNQQVKNQQLTSKLHILQRRIRNYDNCFNEDQIRVFHSSTSKGLQWSSATIQKAFKILSACGSKGYKHLLKEKFPLPSLRTLFRSKQMNKNKNALLSDSFSKQES